MITDIDPGIVNDPVVILQPGGFNVAPYVLFKELVYVTHKAGGRVIEIPKGFKSDLLSIPWLFRRLFPRGGWGKRASIVHDWLCATRPDWSTSVMSAEIFDECLKSDGCPKYIRKSFFYAVKYFGPRWK